MNGTDEEPLPRMDWRNEREKNMKHSILLISPPFLPFQRKGQEPCFPLGLGYVASSLEAEGFEVNILDMEADCQEYSEQKSPSPNSSNMWQLLDGLLANQSPDIVGITVMSPKLANAIKVSKHVRGLLPDCIVIMGGNHPTALPERLLDQGYADFVIRGEGERTIVELCRSLYRGLEIGEETDISGVSYHGRQGIKNNPARPLIEDPDTLPLPGRHLLLNDYRRPESWAGIITSRGCPYRCSFCASRCMWGRRVRYRSIDNVMKEIDQLVRDYGSRYIRFFDDTFTMQRKRLKSLCKAVSEYRPVLTWEATTRVDQLDPDTVSMMASSGCTKVYLGIESGSPRVRERMHKDESLEVIEPVLKLLNKHGILSVGFYMTGIPSETVEDMEKTRRLMVRLKTSYTALANYTLLPGSDDFKNRPADQDLNEDGNYFLPSEKYISSLPPEMKEMTNRMHQDAQHHDRYIATRVRRVVIRFRQWMRKLFRGLKLPGV